MRNVLLVMIAAASVVSANLNQQQPKVPMGTVAVVESPNYLPSNHRLVMIGDVHGDIENLMENMRHAQVVDIEGHWVSSKDTVVQLGDVTDRGPHAHEVLEFFQELAIEAKEAGGEFIHLLGNHEVMTLKGDTRFANPNQIELFGGVKKFKQAWSTKGPYGAYIAQLDSLVIRNQTLMVHAGLLPRVAQYAKGDIQNLNREMKKNIQDGKWDAPLLMEHGPVWTRQLTRSALKGECALVYETLRIISEFEVSQGRPKVLRMVVGHTIQPFGLVQVLCNEHFVALDIAMSQYFVGGGWLGFVELRPRGGKAWRRPMLFGGNGSTPIDAMEKRHQAVWRQQQQLGDREPSQGQWEDFLADTEDYLAMDTEDLNPNNIGPLVRYPPDRDRKHVFQKMKKPSYHRVRRYLRKDEHSRLWNQEHGVKEVNHEAGHEHEHGKIDSELGPFSLIGIFSVVACMCWALTVILPFCKRKCCPSPGATSGRKRYPDDDAATAGSGVTTSGDQGGDQDALVRRRRGVL